MKLEEFGYNENIQRSRDEQGLMDFGIGRVVAEHRERYIVLTGTGEVEAEVTGNLRFTARSREDFPAVGDWVALITADEDFALIHKILPRYSVISRRAAGHSGEMQVMAANIDCALLLQATDRDFNINRLERYLTICHSSCVKPVIVLTKTDLISEQRKAEIIQSIQHRIEDVPVVAISNETLNGYQELNGMLEKGKTYCMLGSSGVGKSTLLNKLAGRNIMKTDSISLSSDRGRHITSHRELIVLEGGSMLIDNPGMREVGITDASGGLEATFDRIINLSQSCRFKDCTHNGETGCSVIEALERGEIDRDSYDNFMKMEREKQHYEMTVAERRRKEKVFGKIIRDYKSKDIKGRNH